MLGLLLLDGQAGLRLDLEETVGRHGGGRGHRLRLHLARVYYQGRREVCVHFYKNIGL